MSAAPVVCALCTKAPELYGQGKWYCANCECPSNAEEMSLDDWNALQAAIEAKVQEARDEAVVDKAVLKCLLIRLGFLNSDGSTDEERVREEMSRRTKRAEAKDGRGGFLIREPESSYPAIEAANRSANRRLDEMRRQRSEPSPQVEPAPGQKWKERAGGKNLCIIESIEGADVYPEGVRVLILVAGDFHANLSLESFLDQCEFVSHGKSPAKTEPQTLEFTIETIGKRVGEVILAAWLRGEISTSSKPTRDLYDEMLAVLKSMSRSGGPVTAADDACIRKLVSRAEKTKP